MSLCFIIEIDMNWISIWRETIDKLIDYFRHNLGGMGKEMTFLLGFYVSNIVRRWWDTYRQGGYFEKILEENHPWSSNSTTKYSLLHTEPCPGQTVWWPSAMRWSTSKQRRAWSSARLSWDTACSPTSSASGDSARRWGWCFLTTSHWSRPRWPQERSYCW